MKWARLYKAYMFPREGENYREPVVVFVLTTDFERALGLVRKKFPGRHISALHGECAYEDIPTHVATIVDSDLPAKKPAGPPCDAKGRPLENRRYFFSEAKKRAVPSEDQVIRECLKRLKALGVGTEDPLVVNGERLLAAYPEDK